MGYILVVDDDENIRDLINFALLDEGYEVVTTPDGRKALEAVKKKLPDLILLDMRMPVMDGWAFAREYRQVTATRAPIVVLTAAVDAGMFANQIQAEGFLPKPFELEDLFKVVNQYKSP